MTTASSPHQSPKAGLRYDDDCSVRRPKIVSTTRQQAENLDQEIENVLHLLSFTTTQDPPKFGQKIGPKTKIELILDVHENRSSSVSRHGTARNQR